YCGTLKLSRRVYHERLIRTCFADYDREIPLVADHADPQARRHEILAIGRLNKLHGRREAEFAVVVGDRWQHLGLGTRLLELLVQVGRVEGLSRLSGQIL